jgi:hypothetical protein
MPTDKDPLAVRSHVARDLMQTAGLFKNERLAVWEYVVNGLQYVDPGLSPIVRVTIDPRARRITVADNGRGMDWSGLRNFFVMHGENQDRKQGRVGRGRFGTGKSAAFGIADLLRLTTVRDGKRSRVELSRAAIQAMTDGAAVPVRELEREARTNEPNGTCVEIEGVHLRTISQKEVIDYIQKHLARWPRGATVFVNNHECEVVIPPIAKTFRFRPDSNLCEAIGDVELVIHTSKRALDDEERGIAIYSRGVWHQSTLVGNEGREMAQYIFGEVDVPRLDDDPSPISPIDVSRNMHLNPANDTVRSLFGFLHRHVEGVRKGLMDDDRRRRATEEARKLTAQAAEIARLINEDFQDFRSRFERVRARARGGTDAFRTETIAGVTEGPLERGGSEPARIVASTGSPGARGDGTGRNGEEPRQLAPLLQGDSDGAERGRAAGGSGSTARSAGGFAVRFENMGGDQHRARYHRSGRTIEINLDHPQLRAALGTGSVEDPVFRRLAYEVAFCEYAIALAMEFAQIEGHYLDPDEPIVDIRDHLNRLARKGAHLYSAL